MHLETSFFENLAIRLFVGGSKRRTFVTFCVVNLRWLVLRVGNADYVRFRENGSFRGQENTFQEVGLFQLDSLLTWQAASLRWHCGFLRLAPAARWGTWAASVDQFVAFWLSTVTLSTGTTLSMLFVARLLCSRFLFSARWRLGFLLVYGFFLAYAFIFNLTNQKK